VRNLPRHDLPDPADAAAWQSGAHVEVQDEDAVGGGDDRRMCCVGSMQPTIRGGAVSDDETAV